MKKTLKEQELDRNKYISPIRFFEHCHADLKSPIITSRLKKIINAEFGMSDKGFIEIDNFSYNKSDLLSLVDSNNFEKEIEFHNAVWNNKEVLSLLEEDKVDLNTIFDTLNEFTSNDYQKNEFSKYFVPVFDRFCRSLLNPPNCDTLGDLVALNKYILPEHQIEAHKSIISFFEEKERILRNTSASNISIQKKDLEFWHTQNWYKVLNKLPEYYFDFCDDISVSLINLTVEIQHVNRQLCRNLSSKLIYFTNISDSHKDLIENNHQVFFPNRATNSKDKRSSQSGVSWWWLLWLIVAICRIATSDACKRKISSNEVPEYRKFKTSREIDNMVKPDNRQPSIDAVESAVPPPPPPPIEPSAAAEPNKPPKKKKNILNDEKATREFIEKAKAEYEKWQKNDSF